VDDLPPEYEDLGRDAIYAWGIAHDLGGQHGYRNAQVSCIAPTGTIGIVMDCDTTGVEPDFSIVKHKKLAGGGVFQIINQSVPDALRNLGYDSAEILRLIYYVNGTRKLSSGLREVLQAKGFTESMLEGVEAALASAFHLRFAVAPHHAGLDACANQLGFERSDLQQPGFSLMDALGLTSAQIESWNLEICGHRSFGGSSLKPEHEAIFHCAGDISAEGHIRMVAAVQSFVSGAISKTVNLPRSATVEDISEAYMLSWRLGLKANALYRDGSKLSQPLSASLAANLFGGLEEVVRSYDLPAEPTQEEVIKVAEKLVVRYLSRRRQLPFKRGGYTQKVMINGQKLFLHVGEYEDGTLGEIFVDMSKEGAALGGMLNAFCIAVSIGLQHGVPLERFVNLFTFQTFSPNGMVMGDERVKNCTSIIDYVFRHLAVNYLGRNDLAHTDPGERLAEDPQWSEEKVVGEAPMVMSKAIDVDAAPPVGVSAGVLARTHGQARQEAVGHSLSVPMDATDIARAQGYEGELCSECGQAMMIRNGSCLKCMSCGATTGCS
jgi:ribonucleoside-diphosphate reductase alpha chain